MKDEDPAWASSQLDCTEKHDKRLAYVTDLKQGKGGEEEKLARTH